MAKFTCVDVGKVNYPERQCWEVYFPEIDGGSDYPLVVIERNRTNPKCRVLIEYWKGMASPMYMRCVYRAANEADARTFLRRTFGKLSPDDALALVVAWRKGRKQ